MIAIRRMTIGFIAAWLSVTGAQAQTPPPPPVQNPPPPVQNPPPPPPSTRTGA